MLCRRLDGLPLAIELAASVLSVASSSITWVNASSCWRRDVDAGATGIARCAARSCGRNEPSTPDEQDLYRKLAVFVDWFGLDDATAVAGRLRPIEVLDRLGALGHRSRC